jgi:hypothetical protein
VLGFVPETYVEKIKVAADGKQSEAKRAAAATPKAATPVSSGGASTAAAAATKTTTVAAGRQATNNNASMYPAHSYCVLFPVQSTLPHLLC